MQAEWQRLEELLESALRFEPGRRAAFLDQACAGDNGLRREVESLLGYEEKVDEFMQGPVLDMLSPPVSGEPVRREPRFTEGTLVGPYRILALLGRGGMGEVYRARDTRLDRDAALKFLPELYVSAGEALERFRREARAVSALNHPNICTLYDIGDHEGQPFLVMELVEGESLKSPMARGAVRLEETLSIGSQASEALEAAHAKGIVHRDIKPANILLTPRGAVKVLDFGLAKLRSEPQPEPEAGLSSPASEPESTVTIPGRAVGTASYMSPEQVRGQEVDARSDLFSLGVVLYQLATGARPFEGDSAESIAESILTRQPASPRQRNPAIPAELEKIILRLLQKDRTARYQSATELRADVERLRRPSTAWSRWLALAAAGLLLALVATIAGVRLDWFTSRTPQPTRRAVTATPTEDPAIRGYLSRDGQYVSYMDLAGIHVRRIDTGETHHIRPEPGCCFR